MKKNVLKRIAGMLLSWGIIVAAFNGPVCAQYTRIQQHYFDSAREAIEKKEYRNALLYLETARSVDPENPYIVEYINFVKRALGDKPSAIDTTRVVEISESERARPVVYSRTQSDPILGTQVKNPVQDIGTIETGPVASQSERMSQQRVPSVVSSAVSPSDKLIQHFFELDEDAWAQQPDMDIELGLDEILVFRGGNIHRYLAVTPDVIDIRQLGSRELLVTPLSFGRTFLHIWEDERRWTFNIRTVFRTQLQEQRERLAAMQLPAESFRFVYDFSWNAFSRGPSLDDLDRQALNVRNYFSLFGPTPYGFFDAYTTFYKTGDESTDLIDYSIGLSGASLGDLKNINLRLFDATSGLSDLTLPGRDFRGLLVEGMAQNERFAFKTFGGQDQTSFGRLSPGMISSRDSYFGGGKVSYFPDHIQRFSANYAHSWGDDRPAIAKSNVFSGEYEAALPEFQLLSEIGYDEDQFAALSWSRFQVPNGSFFVRLREIPGGYATVTGPPAQRGEVGVDMSLLQEWGDLEMRNYLDLYRDRENKNPENENAINIDFNTNVIKQLSYRDTLSGDLYFIHTPGILGDRTDSRVSGRYLRRFQLLNFQNGISFSGMYQRARSGTTPAADYNRTGLIALLDMGITKNLNYSIGYEFYYVNDVAIDERSYPTVFNTALYYNHYLTEQWRIGFSAYYRDEEKTEAQKAFMAGQDSLTLGANLTYQPRSGLTAYLDGRVREVWAENNRTDSFTEADIRLGFRSEWDTGLRWNPTGIVQGYVFRDLNNNNVKDPSEEGIPGVKVIVGRNEAVTDNEGWYYIEVNAAHVKVDLDVNTIPDTHVYQNQGMREFNLRHNQIDRADFALTAEAGVYGVVYFDENGNGRPDNGDTFLPKVKMVLDQDRVATTDSKGSYFFYNISPGMHQVAIDLNSLPIEYLPMISLSNEIEVAEGATYIFHVPVTKKQLKSE